MLFARRCAMLLTFLTVVFAATIHAAETETIKKALVSVLTESAKGKCAEELMSPILLDACEQQREANRALLEPLGKIVSATYRGIQEMPNGVKAEAYKIKFENGSMMWVASLDGAGKLLVLWSTGQVQTN